MAQKSGSKRSKMGLEQHHPGCMESLLHFAFFQGSWQQRLHLKKMIAYKRHTDTSHRTRIKIPKLQHCFIKEGSKLQVEESKLPSPSKSPTKSHTKSPRKDLLKPLKFKKKLTEKGHRRCVTSLPPSMATRLVRTISMHHLKDCNYVFPNGCSDNQKVTNDRVFLHHSGISATNESNFLQNDSMKACQQCGKVPSINSVDQIHQSKDVLDFLQFFNENKNLLMNIARNPQILLAKESLEKHVSSDDGIGLNKSQTFPRPGIPENREPLMPSLTPNNSKSTRYNIKKAIKENKKEFVHISNDGILHKVPYGQKDWEGHKRNYWKKGGGTRMRRSTSLVESLDKYSNLFECISKDEAKTTDCMAALPEMRSDSGFKRIHSSPEIKLYSAILPPSVATSRDIRGVRSVHSFVEAEPSDSASCNDKAVELLDPQQCPSEVEKVDPESHEQPNLEVERIYDGPFSDDDAGGICLKQSHSGCGSVEWNEAELEDEQKEVEGVDEYKYNIAVDESEEAYFQYMKEVLAKCDLTGSEWHSQAVLDPALLEVEAELSPDQLLLFDLVNEALVEAYEAWLLAGRWGLMRRGDEHWHLHMVEEVWGRLKKQLNCMVEVATEEVVAADVRKKKDGWMELKVEGEAVGLELEDCIMEDLLEETINHINVA